MSSVERCLLLQERGDEGEDVLCDDPVSGGGGVGSVFLHHAGDSEDALEKKRQQRDAVFFCKQGVGCVEAGDVVGAVVGRERDACEDDGDLAGFEGGYDLIQIGAGVFDAQAAEAVVAAELDDDGGLHGDDSIEAVDAVFGGVSADAFVDDAVVIASGVERGLEVVGIALAGVGAVAFGEAVAETDDERTGV